MSKEDVVKNLGNPEEVRTNIFGVKWYCYGNLGVAIWANTVITTTTTFNDIEKQLKMVDALEKALDDFIHLYLNFSISQYQMLRAYTKEKYGIDVGPDFWGKKDTVLTDTSIKKE